MWSFYLPAFNTLSLFFTSHVWITVSHRDFLFWSYQFDVLYASCTLISISYFTSAIYLWLCYIIFYAFKPVSSPSSISIIHIGFFSGHNTQDFLDAWCLHSFRFNIYLTLLLSSGPEVPFSIVFNLLVRLSLWFDFPNISFRVLLQLDFLRDFISFLNSSFVSSIVFLM